MTFIAYQKMSKLCIDASLEINPKKKVINVRVLSQL